MARRLHISTGWISDTKNGRPKVDTADIGMSSYLLHPKYRK
jgi:hypothetical protein